MLPAMIRGAVVVALAALTADAAHAAKKATVRGAEVLNVRRAPSLDSPPFATLPKGTEVSVEKVSDGWALINLPGGHQGYAKAVYLDLSAGGAVARDTPVAALTFTPALTPSPLATATSEAVAATTPHGAVERELAQLRTRMAALESAVAVTPGAPAARREDAGSVPAAPAIGEATRTAVLLPSAVPPLEQQEIGPSLALAGVGLVIGFFLGAAYGRRQERNRRTRVRF